MSLPVRLPTHVAPRRYRLSLDIDPATDDYLGEVDIHLDVAESTQTIELHAVELAIDSATLRVSGAGSRSSSSPFGSRPGATACT